MRLLLEPCASSLLCVFCWAGSWRPRLRWGEYALPIVLCPLTFAWPQFLVVNGFSGSDCTGALVLSVAVETGNAALGNLTCKRVKCGAVPVPSAFEAGGGLKVGLSYSVLCVTSMPAVALPLVATVW